MPTADLFLAYGKVTDPVLALAREGAELALLGHALGRQTAWISDGTAAFRLNSGGWLSVPPELVAALPSRADLRTLCRDRIDVLIPTFAPGARRWIGHYLDRAAALAPLNGPIAGVVDPSDRFFSVLLPLPNAQVAIRQRSASRASGATRGDFVCFDLALWDGEVLTGLLIGGENSRPPAARTALGRLQFRMGARLRVLRVDGEEASRLSAGAMAELVREVPPPWIGPFRADAFHAPLP